MANSEIVKFIECTHPFRNGMKNPINNENDFIYEYLGKIYFNKKTVFDNKWIGTRDSKEDPYFLDVEGQAYIIHLLKLTHTSLVKDIFGLNLVSDKVIIIQVHPKLVWVYWIFYPFLSNEITLPEISKEDIKDTTVMSIDELIKINPNLKEGKRCYKCIYHKGLGPNVTEAFFRSIHICPSNLFKLQPDSKLHNDLMYSPKTILWDDVIDQDLFEKGF